MKLYTLLVLVMGILLLLGCEKAVDNGTDSAPVQNDNAQIANPASVFCNDNGGTLEIKDTAEGQVGYCTLATGEICEEWAYFRGECPA